MKIREADILDFEKIEKFFQKFLDKNNSGIYSEELLCPLGLKRAVKDGNILILENQEKEILAGLKFYKRKKDNIVSLYQFAIDEKYRGQDFLKKILVETGYKKFQTYCPKDSEFNFYYQKTGWVKIGEWKELNIWELNI